MKSDIENLRLSELVELIRDKVYGARSTLEKVIRKHGWKDQLDCVEGLLTCGMVTLFDVKEKIVMFEIKKDDAERGPHLKFQPRGIGLDVCPCCFVCGTEKRNEDANHYLNNISAFVKTREDGEEIVKWFNGRARCDFRKFEPDWIQVKVGACDAHLHNLNALERATSRYGVIREIDIKEAAEK